MIKKIAFSLLFWTITTSLIHAQTNRTLVEEGDWSVEEYTHPSDPTSNACIANSSNGPQSVSFYAYARDYDALEIGVWDSRWEIGTRPVSFVVSVGNARWEIDGEAYDTSVGASLESQAQSQSFMDEVAIGNSLVFETANGNPLAAFALSGSSTAMYTLAECWARIQPNNGGAADPFSDNSTSAQSEDPVQRTLTDIFDWVSYEVRFPNEPSADNCNAYTETEQQNFWLSVSAFDLDQIEVMLQNQSWELGERSVEFDLVIGSRRWQLRGDTIGSQIFAYLNGRELVQSLFEELRAGSPNGSRVTFETKDGNPMGDFSLHGANAAIFALAGCWERIDVTDKTVTDPFANDESANQLSIDSSEVTFDSSANADQGYGGFMAYIVDMHPRAFLLMYDQQFEPSGPTLNSTSKKIGRIPGDAEDIRVIWCENYGSELWCDVSWDGQRGFVLGANLQNVEGGPG